MEINGIALFAIGFGLGVLLTTFKEMSERRDLLDRLSWRQPSDYFFMTYQRKTLLKENSLLSKLNPFKKKKVVEIPPGIPISQEIIKKDIDKQMEAQEESGKHYREYVEQRQQMADTGVASV